jgi:hypothetical protein
MNIEEIYEKFFDSSDDLSIQDKYKVLRRKNLLKLSNKVDASTQTNHNVLSYSIEKIPKCNKVIQNNNYKKVLNDVQINHDNSIITDSAKENYGTLKNSLVKGNIFVGDIIVTVGTYMIDVKSDNVSLCFDGIHGNILLNIYASALKLEANSIKNRHHGYVILNNITHSTINISLDPLIFYPSEAISLKSLQKTQMYYMTYNDKVYFRNPTLEKMNNIDFNDLANIFKESIHEKKFKDLNVQTSDKLSTLNFESKLKIVNDNTDILNIESVPSSSNTYFVDLENVKNKYINVNINLDTNQIIFKPFGIQRVHGQGLITIINNSQKTTDIIFSPGFLKKEGQITVNTNTTIKLFYNHLSYSNTIIRVQI